MQTARISNNQREYDDALPAEDPPEAPNMDGEIGDLMTGEDTWLLTYNAFRQSAAEDMYRLAPDTCLVDFILSACRSSDPVMRGKAELAYQALQAHAGVMLACALTRHEKRIGGRP
jgi:hypothetical protein